MEYEPVEKINGRQEYNKRQGCEDHLSLFLNGRTPPALEERPRLTSAVNIIPAMRQSQAIRWRRRKRERDAKVRDLSCRFVGEWREAP